MTSTVGFLDQVKSLNISILIADCLLFVFDLMDYITAACRVL